MPPDAPAVPNAAPAPDASAPTLRTVAVLGNPNVGKTTLFNRLSGLRHRTANFPGTTQEAHLAALANHPHIELIDLPGVYSLELDLSESAVCRDALAGRRAPAGHAVVPPDALLIVADATNLRRNLTLVGEAMRRRLPTVVALNMTDAARRRGIAIDAERLAGELGCPVVPVSARTGEGLADLTALLARTTQAESAAGTVRPPSHSAAAAPAVPAHSVPEGEDALDRWADELYAAVAAARPSTGTDTLTDRLDRAFTHPLVGLASFAIVMTALFWVIFRLAAYPMDWIDAAFTHLGGAIEAALPAGLVRDLLVEGVVAGVAGTLVFLPQICLLFFLITFLEGTGYLARAAFVIDRVLRPFGLPGHAFVPLLSAHACALPAIMSARAVPDRRDRLATILVIPFMSCTARIPVYVLLTTLLFPRQPGMQALAFTGCYALGIAAGLVSAVIARRGLLRGRSRPMALELPPYRLPSLRTCLLATLDRGWMFLKKAGTVILCISIVLWWLGAFPHAGASAEGDRLRAEAAVAEVDPHGEHLLAQAEAADAAHAARSTFLARLGSALEPVFAPIGADRQLTVGILASFAAREVFVSTMAVQVVGTDDAEAEGVFEALATAERDDGSPVFTAATSWAMLVYFVLAMQCLPTLVVTAKEAGGWRWAGLQFAWMTALAYAGALLVYQILRTTGSA
jgi:ferrous iron transport protein B